MLPVIAIVGRPNVGKSTLFNYLTQSRDALVADWPGVTRDRQYGLGAVGERDYWVIDTGGMADPDDPEMAELSDLQVLQAMQEANVIFFVVDAKAGLTEMDRFIAQELRQSHAGKVVLLINKADREAAALVAAEFYELGLGEPEVVAATMGRGLPELMHKTLAAFPVTEVDADAMPGIRIAVVGRPNVGKSPLINRLLGEDRVIVLDRPGTTRDSIAIPFERRDQMYTLIDTAGVRRRARVDAAIEKFSVIKTLRAMELAQVVIMVIDAREVVTDQDMHLLAKIVELGKALIIVFNKWDGMDEYDREQFMQSVDRKLEFVKFARRYTISALHGSGCGQLFHAIQEAYEAVLTRISTADLTKAIEIAQRQHQPPLVRGRRVKLRYAHIGGQDPLIIVIHGKQVDDLPGSYKKFLINFFRQHFKIGPIPIIVQFKNDQNPYA